MAFTDLNTQERLVQPKFAEHLETELGWESVYAWNDETFRANGTLGRNDACEVVLSRDLQRAIPRNNPDLLQAAVEAAIAVLANAMVHRPYSQRSDIVNPPQYARGRKYRIAPKQAESSNSGAIPDAQNIDNSP